MKKIILLFTVFLLISQFQTRADEGMWLLTLLKKNYNDMKKQGFKLTPEDIYNVNKGSIKDAVVQFGQNGRGFCTAEIVSDQGLLLTNHHCGYGSIQYHSSVDHDYLKDGYWAQSLKDELYTPGQMVRFLVSIEDVTAKVTKGVTGNMSEEDRDKLIDGLATKVEEEALKGKDTKIYEARVQSFFGGNQYFLILYKVYNDVRFVGAPPSSIGKFGHDTDNWMWPRHTGDFSVFRIYMSKEGEAAEYSTENIPLKPKYSLPVSLKGFKKGDFTMVMGYPGSTQRYMTSWEVDEVNSITHPNRIKIRGVRQEIMMKDMKADSKVNIQYSSKYSRSSNYWKFSIGQKRGLERLKIADKKRALEAEFTKWFNASKDRLAKYSQALPLIEKSVKGRAELRNVTQYIAECFLQGVEISGMAGSADKLAKLLADKTAKKEVLNIEIESLKRRAEDFFKDYNMPTDKKITAAMISTYEKDIDKKYYPLFYEDVQKLGGAEKFTEELFKSSIFSSKEKLEAFLQSPIAEGIQNDLAYKMYVSISSLYGDLNGKMQEFNTEYEKGHRLFLAGLMEMQPEKNFYPDANFTMRLTYGTVGDYKPADAVVYDYLTTLDGVMEKYKPGDYEFDLPQKLINIYDKKDFGQYAIDPVKLTGAEKQEHLEKFGNKVVMPVCFTSNNDITGGNSGSPVMNGSGELVGIAFDGNWEAMSGDVAFETELQKCINVDIRYVLFIMDKFGGAKRLIDEMKTIK